MKKVGVILIGVGLALLIWGLYSYLTNQTRFISPIPEDNGIRVIYISPTQ